MIREGEAAGRASPGAGEALAESERRFRALFDQAFQFLALTRTDGTVLDVNRGALALIGGRIEELRGRLFWETPWWAHAPAEQQRLRQALAAAARGEFVRYETTVGGPDGQRLTIDFSLKPLHDEAGRVALLIAEGRDISERVLAAEALRRTRDQLDATLGALPDLFFEVDRDGRIVDFRAPHPELLYVPPAEFLGKTIRELMPEPVAAVLLASLERAAVEGSCSGETYTLETPAGTGWFEPSVARKGDAREVDARDVDARFVVLVRDVTARCRAEQDAQRREQLLRVLNVIGQRLMGGASWMESCARNLADLGEAAGVSRVYLLQIEVAQDGAVRARRRFAWAAPGVSAAPLEELAFAGRGLQRWQQLLESGEPLYSAASRLSADEQAFLAAQGVRSVALAPVFVEHSWWGLLGFDDCSTERQWSAAELAVLRSAAGSLGAALARERTIQELRDSESTYRTIFETTGSAMIIYDEEGRITLANREAAKLTAYSVEELEGGKTWCDLFAPRSVEKLEAYQRRCDASLEPVPRSYEATLVDRQGRQRSVIIVVDVIPGTRQSVAGFLDITGRKQAEAQMLRADKMAALGQIIAGVAHEINNPNNFIYFNLPILGRYLEALRPILDEHAARHPGLKLLNMPYEAFIDDLFKLLENMRHGSERITGIVSELKHYVRGRDDEERKPTSVGTIVDHVMVLVGKQVQKMVKQLEVHVEAQLPPLLACEGKVEQVLINLLINAGQAADKADSFVKLTARRGAGDPPHVEIVVEDNGTGISEEDLDRVFDPFFTTKGREAGTGLGLAISQRIIEEHGGKITVTSVVGQGSRFGVTLPATEPQPDLPRPELARADLP